MLWLKRLAHLVPDWLATGACNLNLVLWKGAWTGTSGSH
jgi:hypothetical protein